MSGGVNIKDSENMPHAKTQRSLRKSFC